MENTNYNRNQSYQQDWNENDQGYDRYRNNQNRYQGYSNDYRGSENARNQEWQNGGDRGGYNDQYTAGNYNNRRGYYDDQNRGDYNKSYNQNRENDYRGNWNRNYDEGNYGSDYRNKSNTRERNWWDRTSDEVASWFGDDDAERRRRMDKINGPHRGKGPKGYTRSDERITDDINEKLSDDSYIDASNIEVSVSNGDVTLSGTVDSRESKRRAEDIAESVSGVKDVTNQLRVSATTQYDASGSQSRDQYNEYNGRKKSSLLS